MIAQLNELDALNHDMSLDVAAANNREAGHLSYIASLSDQVTKLQLENTEHVCRVNILSAVPLFALTNYWLLLVGLVHT